jgi:hypothetical protein
LYGADNTVPVPLTVGQGLAWETWHHVALVIDQRSDRCIFLTVDGQTQLLGNPVLPRSFDADAQVWKRRQLIGRLQMLVTARHWDSEKTDDDIYWDNITPYGQCLLNADLSGDCRVDMEDLSLLAVERLMGI